MSGQYGRFSALRSPDDIGAAPTGGPGAAAPPHGDGARVSERLERQAMLQRLIADVPLNLERMFQFILHSTTLAGTHTRHGTGPVSTVGFRVQGTVIDEILPWGEWLQSQSMQLHLPPRCADAPRAPRY